VFTRTKHGADKVVKGLERAGIAAAAIHGNKSQNHRERTLAQFRTGEIRTLVATDIAARGIDVDGITHVVNFDLPNIVPETYVHRIGRTARAGGPRNPRRDGVKSEHGGQPHRVRKPRDGQGAGGGGGGQRDRTHHSDRGDRPLASTQPFDPLAADRARSAANANRPQAPRPEGQAKPDGEFQRRPRGRRPSNGGKGYAKA
jgi:ATP-dependent RNA helicase RhlE